MNPNSAFRTGEGVWTHVSKALPSALDEVLVYDGDSFRVGYWAGAWFDKAGNGLEDVSHWVNLPYKPGAAPTDG